MSKIRVSPIEAARYSAAITSSGRQLNLSAGVTFSSGTTVPGNAVAKEQFSKLKQTPNQVLQLLQRDTHNIHSVVSTFQQLDQQNATLFQNFGSKGKK